MRRCPALRELKNVAYAADNARDPDQYGYQVKGTTADWQREVAIPLRGNSNVVLALATSFASALIPFTDEQRGGVHLHGITGIDSPTARIAVLPLAQARLHRSAAMVQIRPRRTEQQQGIGRLSWRQRGGGAPSRGFLLPGAPKRTPRRSGRMDVLEFLHGGGDPRPRQPSNPQAPISFPSGSLFCRGRLKS